MPITAYVVAAEAAERTWIDAALAQGSGIDIVFSDDGASLLDRLPTGLSCVIAMADLDEAATLALVQELKRRDAKLPVIVLGPHSAFRTAVEIARLPATDFLERPVSAHQLRAAVRACFSVNTGAQA
ncbi:response regulator [Variovorax sp. LARHSF232]